MEKTKKYTLIIYGIVLFELYNHISILFTTLFKLYSINSFDPFILILLYTLTSSVLVYIFYKLIIFIASRKRVKFMFYILILIAISLTLLYSNFIGKSILRIMENGNIDMYNNAYAFNKYNYYLWYIFNGIFHIILGVLLYYKFGREEKIMN